ncbi:uncharacterized protein J3R85_010210 [Psidium guajava]|nr:uncharacterized protein J3R85_010210 [Psidium guajava]
MEARTPDPYLDERRLSRRDNGGCHMVPATSSMCAARSRARSETKQWLASMSTPSASRVNEPSQLVAKAPRVEAGPDLEVWRQWPQARDGSAWMRSSVALNARPTLRRQQQGNDGRDAEVGGS